MNARLVWGALFKSRNIGALIVLLGLSMLLADPSVSSFFDGVIPVIPPSVAFPASFVIYLAMAVQSVLSKDFKADFECREKKREIRKLYSACSGLFREVKKNTNEFYFKKLKKVSEDKDDIYNSYLNNQDNYLKEKITEQTLNLVISYMRLLNNYCIRSRELSTTDQRAIIERINANARKLNFTKDPALSENLRKIIEIDEKLIERMNEEKRELEKISARLDFMESTVSMFKHQVISSIETEEMLESLENAVNEAEALDSVLEGRKKAKRRI